ncbi:MAG: hypothetical protein ACKO45_01940 [Cyanobium sp.]
MPQCLCSTLAVTAAVFFSAAPGQAQVFFSDNFDSNTPAFNTVPIGWTNANAGTVDFIGVCSGSGPLFDFFPGNGCYIDLDGSTDAAGKLKKSFTLTGGFSYELSFDLGTTQNNSVFVTFGDTTSLISLFGVEPLTKRSLAFSPVASGNYDVIFQDQGGDGSGGILDNVRITESVPGPLPILGVASAFLASRRMRARIRKAQP